MKFFFDYMWYRVAKIYYKWDSDGMTATGFLSLSQGLFIGYFVRVAIHYIPYLNTLVIKIGYENYTRFGVGIIVCLLVINYFKYKKKYWKYREYWRNETRTMYYLKGLLVIVFLILPSIMFFYSPSVPY